MQVLQVLRWIVKDIICTLLKAEIFTVASDLKALTQTHLKWVHNLNWALRGNNVFSNQLGISRIPDLDYVGQAVWSHFVDTFYFLSFFSFFFNFSKQTPSSYGGIGEYYRAVLLISSRNVLWTAILRLTFHQHTMSEPYPFLLTFSEKGRIGMPS